MEAEEEGLEEGELVVGKGSTTTKLKNIDILIMDRQTPPPPAPLQEDHVIHENTCIVCLVSAARMTGRIRIRVAARWRGCRGRERG